MKRILFCALIIVVLLPSVASAQTVQKTKAWSFAGDELVINLPTYWWGWENQQTLASANELAGYIASMTGLDQGDILNSFDEDLNDVGFVGLDGLNATTRVMLYLNDDLGIPRNTESEDIGQTAFEVEFTPLDIYNNRDVSYAYSIDDQGLVQLWFVETFQGQVIVLVQVEALTEYWMLHEDELKAIALSVRLTGEDPEINPNLVSGPPEIGAPGARF